MNETAILLSGILGTIGGAVLSLLFNTIPGLQEWYSEKVPKMKQLILVGVLALSAVGWFGVSCLNPPFDVVISCDVNGGWSMMAAFVFAVMGSQGMHLGTKYIPDRSKKDG